ncbi:Pyrimidine nucleoside phosphorylase, C-terminal [Pseudocohnilembus persalinus]|uniref:Thymidine phosphorylase n=1 Tax=Pseudocohnilembus persalinus TaxID=266149 RepID=A0A0V0QTK7_PSEPJ|nr:Pyrimidine nucleoside phosphorylase, C-terminal [Pseudocohnilembus persalinus]|eukprot:KRX05537.1 Pyrimidine nucleoside phosphorylase, C-terminal [Pseudocohnilembus persalinus]
MSQQFSEKEDILFSDILKTKKQGNPLNEKQIKFWIDGVTNKTIPEYQTAALLMLIFCKGMNIEERSYLTKAMGQSGQTMNYSHLPQFKIDKHSTGGIGDKTSFIISSLYCSLGLINPMVSGRGLGHTGGTVDKIESIPNIQTSLTFNQMKKMVSKIGGFIGGQTDEIAPADKIIYGLRDVTETVDDISLITASILSKKLSEGLNGLTLDIKCGSGAFMQTFPEAIKLGESLIKTANAANVKCQGLVTRMDYPIGQWVGNSCEIWECIQAMTPGSDYCNILDRIQFNEKNHGKIQLNNQNNDLTDIREMLVFMVVALTLNSLIISGEKPNICLEKIKQAWKSGKALENFKQIIESQGGDYQQYIKNNQKILDAFKNIKDNHNIYEFKSPVNGKIKSINGVEIGVLLVALGAGRKIQNDKINHDVSLQWLVHPNQYLKKGDVIARFYHPDPQVLQQVQIDKKIKDIIQFTDDVNYQDPLPLIYCVIDNNSTLEQLQKMY